MENVPVELLARIFSGLPYFDLLAVSAVCNLWYQIIQEDTFIRQLMFKTPSPNSSQLVNGEAVQGNFDNVANSPYCRNIRLHPAITRMSYYMGQEFTSVGFHSRSPDATTRFLPLAQQMISKDFASAPSVEKMEVEICPQQQLCAHLKNALCIKFTVRNLNGVRVGDLFTALATGTRKSCDLISFVSGGGFGARLHPGQKMAKALKAEILGENR